MSDPLLPRAAKAVLLAPFLALMLAACVQPASPGAREADPGAQDGYAPLRVITSFRIRTLDPVAQGFWMVEFGAAELLMKLDRDLTLKPWVLQSLDSIDELNWRLTLRPNVTFQNGKVLGADALKALLTRQLELSPEARAELPGASAKVAGQHEIVLTTSRPTPELPSLLAQESVFPVYDVETVKRVGEEYDKLAGAGIYTGPYAPVRLNSEALVLERYDRYWQGRPPLRGVTIGFVGDAQARILAVQNGEADIALYVPSEAKTIVAGRSDAYFVTAPKTIEGVLVIFNQRTPPFDDTDVRRAFALGIDYSSIARQVLNEVYEVAEGYYPASLPWLVKNQATDADMANRLLDKAGWIMGADGFRARAGQTLKVALLIYPQQPDLVPISTAMQAQLKRIGFKIEIQSVDSLTDAMRGHLIPWSVGLTFSAAINGGGGLQLHRYVASQGDRNYGGISNPELDDLIAKLYVTSEQSGRLEYLRRIQTILVEEQALQLYVANKLFPAVVGPAYRNYVPSPNLINVTWETRPAE